MREAEPAFVVIGLPRSNLHKEIPLHVQSYDTIIIDDPPRVNEGSPLCRAIAFEFF